MSKLIFSVLAFACTLAFAAGTAAQLSEMIKFMTYTYSLANYTNYGCHCGSNTQGVPVDETDWCCHEHACCYNKARMMGCVPEATTYRFYAYKDKIKCIKTHNKCEYEVCDCDEEAADCFRKRLDTYNLHFRNMTASPSCHGPRPFC
ncbi:phospholipase A2 homolog otoconin-22-like [Ambystoma mexicanum]|uniref:phospholipase A2 homolog otoconin-22-like n=1 Tax=Ambystoma mexicanum TaxID=8296 RepID=UPI0037E6F8F6